MISRTMIGLLWLGLSVSRPVLASSTAGVAGVRRDAVMKVLRVADSRMGRAGLHEQEGRTGEALRLYREALEEYEQARKRYPDIETGFITFRIDQCRRKIETLSAASPPVSETLETDAGTPEKPEEAAGEQENPESVATPAAPGPPSPGGTDPAPESGAESEPGPAAETLPEADLEKIGLRVRVLQARRQFSRAEDVLNEALNVAPKDPRLILWLASVKLETQAYGEAADTLAMLENDSDDECVWLLSAAAAVGQGNDFEALRALDKALRANPYSSRAYMNLARLRYRMNPGRNREEAAAYYRQALHLGARPDREFEMTLNSSRND